MSTVVASQNLSKNMKVKKVSCQIDCISLSKAMKRNQRLDKIGNIISETYLFQAIWYNHHSAVTIIKKVETYAD